MLSEAESEADTDYEMDEEGMQDDADLGLHRAKRDSQKTHRAERRKRDEENASNHNKRLKT